jgi:hypothetical protein
MKAMSVAAGKEPSDVVVSSPLLILASEPYFVANGTAWGDPGPAVEEFVKESLVHIESSTPDSRIYYTLDDHLPSLTSKMYATDRPIVISSFGNTTIMVIAMAPGKAPSLVAKSQIFEIIDRVSKAEIRPLSGTTHVTFVEVSIRNAESGGTLYFTTDGTDPTSKSEAYTAPFRIYTAGDVVIKAIVGKTDLANSNIVTDLVLRKGEKHQ